MEELHFLIRKVKRDTGKLPKDVAVVAISETKDDTHFVFEEEHHSLEFDPEVARYLKLIPTKFRHLKVKLKNGEVFKYRNAVTKDFQFKGVVLRKWQRPLNTLTGNFFNFEVIHMFL